MTLTKEEEEKLNNWMEEEMLKKAMKKLPETFKKIVKILKHYCDLREDYYNIIAIWIIGSYLHKQFMSYPYLFFNAMRGSGKSRILKLIAELSWNGKVLISMTESVLFRTANQRTLCIDEFESVGSREKQALRELLNVAYKQGGSVERAYKSSENIGASKIDRVKIESFDVYCPVVMANIWGMDNVLSDRCLTLILDKSSNVGVTRLIENFEQDSFIQNTKKELNELLRINLCRKCMYDRKNNIEGRINKWNIFIKHTLHTLHTYNDNPTLPTQDMIEYYGDSDLTIEKEDYDLFNKILSTGLEGRVLELFFPLFLIADMCGIINEFINISKKIYLEKKSEDITENRDVALLVHLTENMPETKGFVLVKDIARDIKEGEDDWVTPEWTGRALKRLNLVIEKKRSHLGMEVKIDFKKAKEKIKMFKVMEEDKEMIIIEPINDIDKKILARDENDHENTL